MSGRRTTLVVVGLVIAFLAPMSTAYALWSRTASATLNVSVAAPGPPPAAPTISCQPRTSSTISFTWPVVGGLTYTVHDAGSNADASYSAGSTPSGSGAHVVTPASGTTRFYRVKANNGSSTSGWSNTVRVTRTGGTSTIACTGVTP